MKTVHIMERELIDEDPLNGSFLRLCMNYETTRHKLKLCTPEFPIYKHGDFILLGDKKLLDERFANHYSGNYLDGTKKRGFGHSFEVYSKREWLVKWCERKIENGGGWYLLRDIAPLFLRELKNGNSYIHFFELIKEYELKLLKAQMDRYNTVRGGGDIWKDDDIDAETVEWLEYTGGSALCENELIRKSFKVRMAIFGDLLRNGELVMLHRPGDRLELIKEIEYYGMGVQVAPLAGDGGIYFVYNNEIFYYYNTWIS